MFMTSRTPSSHGLRYKGERNKGPLSPRVAQISSCHVISARRCSRARRKKGDMFVPSIKASSRNRRRKGRILNAGGEVRVSGLQITHVGLNILSS